MGQGPLCHPCDGTLRRRVQHNLVPNDHRADPQMNPSEPTEASVRGGSSLGTVPPRRHVYFDTNVYGMIASLNEAREMRAYCKANNLRVLTSAFNLLELARIPSVTQRDAEERVLLQVATTFEPEPMAYRHAMEVLYELRRIRPDWVRPFARKAQIRKFLKSHKTSWNKFCRRIPANRLAESTYHRDAESGAQASLLSQKFSRSTRLEANNLQLISFDSAGLRVTVPLDLQDADQAWRTECLHSWHNAIVLRSRASRDYHDYLGPHLKPTAFQEEAETLDFWLRNVDGARVPLNRLVGLTHHFQLAQRITHGNAVDSLHACYLLDVDLFVTADKPFATALTSAAALVPESGQVVCVNRGASSSVSELARVITSKTLD